VADISGTYPDRAHEALRQELLAAIAAGQDNTAGVDDSYYLTDALFGLIDSLLAQIDTLQQRVANLEASG
jgi:hypothetical protein